VVLVIGPKPIQKSCAFERSDAQSFFVTILALAASQSAGGLQPTRSAGTDFRFG
jgi:hypothetical protein